ncbi:hypothetical protein [Pinibacter soli]|uniref:Uncharacterized protein n=1 Tax=Pinibacter soli TaxID=3044211 RepID=A0ABT6RHY4_9BACT|nr:hypothetical protein [Pinibacter soli]MDI3322179.1 hypothetical protein [Pinibacter soli]
MITNKTLLFVVFAFLLVYCRTQIKVDEKDKIFHAGPVNSGFGVIYFGLYKGNKYQFCDGDFMDPGCYTGNYDLSGDTIIMHDLRKHHGIQTNKFLIRRYSSMDSSYWQGKYPDHKDEWQNMRQRDLANGATGDIVPLNSNGNIVFDKDNYFLIRFDQIKNNQ